MTKNILTLTGAALVLASIVFGAFFAWQWYMVSGRVMMLELELSKLKPIAYQTSVKVRAIEAELKTVPMKRRTKPEL